MANYEYSTYSSSTAGGVGGGTNQIFSQADTNKDGTLDRAEFSNLVTGGTGQAGAGVGGVGGNFGSSSYESSGYSSTGGALGVDAGYGGFGGVSSYEAANYSSDVGLDAGAFATGGFQSSSYDSSMGGLGFDVAAINQAAGYTSETNAAWSRYGADVRGAGLYVDTNPQIIRRQAPGGVHTYTQNIRVRFLQPPPVPPPGPLIIREVRPPQPPPPPPLRIKQQAPPLPTPPPLVLRERPPQPPAAVASQTVIRRLAAVPVPPRSVIIERLPPAPARPRDIIIERWVPYGPAAKRKTIVQRAAAAKAYAPPRNIIIQYEQAQVRVVRQFQRLGVTLENPLAYIQRYGGQLLDAQTLVQQARAAGVVEDISPPLVAGANFSGASFSQESSFGIGGGLSEAEYIGGVGGDLGGVSSYSTSNFESSQVGGHGGLSGVGLDTGLVGGAGGNYGSSGFESSSYSSSAGGVGGVSGGAGFDSTATAFNNADTNKDGTLSSREFNNFVQGSS